MDQRIAALDLFRTPSHWLPRMPSSEGEAPRVLPKLLIAPLEAGGPPLLSTPNVPHLVITVQDCVMVEQVSRGRRVGWDNVVDSAMGDSGHV